MGYAISFKNRFGAETPVFELDFDNVIQNREENFRVYANKGYTPEETKDSRLLQVIMNTLIKKDSGVQLVFVEASNLMIHHSNTISNYDLYVRIVNSLINEGIPFTFKSI